MSLHDYDLARRFGGLKRLYGESALDIIGAKSVMVVGLGGVGSWAAEALARSAVGRLVLVDLDVVAESNINRQIHALSSTLGKNKIEAMAERFDEINPELQLLLIDEFIEPANAHQLQAKIAMTLVCRELGIYHMMCGGAGGKQNSLALNFSDLSRARNDALLAKVRQQLRKHHGFARGSDSHGRALKKLPAMGVPCLWIDEPALMPWQTTVDSAAGAPLTQAPQGLACAGYGSCVTVTAAMGLAAANQLLRHFYA